MSLSRHDFSLAWRDQGEDTSTKGSEVAWRRYQQTQRDDYETILEAQEASNIEQFEGALKSFIDNPDVSSLVSNYKFISIPSSTIPWKATELKVGAGGLVSTFASGRLWRSRMLDLFLPPQFALYFRVGVNGRVFNSTRDSNTFQAFSAGELYLAPQFPGQFANPRGGRVQAGLKSYELQVHKGAYQVLVVVWKDDTTHEQVTDALNSALAEGKDQDWYGLVGSEVERLQDDYLSHRFPKGWQNLWFLGDNEIYTQENFDGQKGIRCCPNRNVGILQKNFDPAIPLTSEFKVSWDWCIMALPSRLREDTQISHDYLSIAFEFENGRDLTYTWSWELPENHGYWCPLPTWEDREFHVVVRSGANDLGQWLSEERDLRADYVKYISRLNVPTQVVRVWLIAGNRWQRYKGEMLIKKIIMDKVNVL